MALNPSDDATFATFLVASQPWMKHAACTPKDAELFFDVRSYAALDICALCPVRRECGEQAFVEEQNAPYGRYGIRAGMTPQQREVIWRRGGLHGRDPQLLVKGRDGNRKTPPIPLIGSLWTRHHTTLARKLLAHLRKRPTNYRLLPLATLASQLGCNTSQLTTVLTELWAIGVLTPDGTKRYRLRKVVDSSLPKHLRSTTSGEGDSRA